jgi:hypothetical protein
MPTLSRAFQLYSREYRQAEFQPKDNPALKVDFKPTGIAEDRIHEMPGDGAEIEERTPKVPGSDARNEMRQPVNISSKNGTMSVSIASVPIAVPFRSALTITIIKAMAGILMSPAIAIPHRRNIPFDKGTDPDSG